MTITTNGVSAVKSTDRSYKEKNFDKKIALWKTPNSIHTHDLRNTVLGWKTLENALDFNRGTDHLVLTYRNDEKNVFLRNDSPLKDNASIIGIASFGYQPFPSMRELMESRIINNLISYAGTPSIRFYGVALIPNFQHQGLGSKIMNEIIFQSKKTNAGILWGYARESAIDFYTNYLNFKTSGDWFKDPTTDKWAIKVASKI